MIKLRNIMTSDVITIPQESSIMEAARLLVSKAVSSLVVVENEKPVAVITETDIINGVMGKKRKVNEVMDKEFEILSPNTTFYELSKYLRDKKVRRFPVVENDKLVGVITETDIIEATRDFTRFHQIMQDVILTIFGLATFFFLFYFSPFGRLLFR